MYISMWWMWPAFVMGRKSVLRRAWTDRYASHFKKGRIVNVYDRAPQSKARKHRKVGELVILNDLYREPLNMMPDSDYEAEGLKFFNEHPYLLHTSLPLDATWRAFDEWRKKDDSMYVIRFMIVSINHEIEDDVKSVIEFQKSRKLMLS